MLARPGSPVATSSNLHIGINDGERQGRQALSPLEAPRQLRWLGDPSVPVPTMLRAYALGGPMRSTYRPLITMVLQGAKLITVVTNKVSLVRDAKQSRE